MQGKDIHPLNEMQCVIVNQILKAGNKLLPGKLVNFHSNKEPALY